MLLQVTICHLVKKILLENRKFLTGIIAKMDPKEMQLGKCLATQMNFTTYTNLVRFKWGRPSQISDKIFVNIR